jgi:hypothetical protein
VLPEIRHNEPNAQREPAVRERRQREAHARLHRRDPAGRLLGVRPRDPKRGLPVAPPPPHISKGSRGSGSRAFNIYIYIYMYIYDILYVHCHHNVQMKGALRSRMGAL